MKSTLRSRLPLLLIVLAGIALRLFRLGADSLWYDETVSTFLAGSPLPELIRHTAGDIHPPGYYALLRGWLILMGYPTGHADPRGNGLEFAAGFFSLFFGVLLIALVYALARRVADRRVALIAAALVAVSPFNVWYGQEVRMYTVGAVLGTVVVYALLRVTARGDVRSPGAEAARLRSESPLKRAGVAHSGHSSTRAKANALNRPRASALVRAPLTTWWTVYALAAAAGMYTLYYFAFLLIPLNLWALAHLLHRRSQPSTSDHQRPASSFMAWFLANLAAVILYAPWIPVAWRQMTDPPVPPWRTLPSLVTILRESWTALSLGQSASNWLWPALLLTLALYILGIANRKSQIANRKSADKPTNEHADKSTIRNPKSEILPLATFGPLALILLVSAVTPLYHVRYLYTYSPAFYVVLAAGVGWLFRQRKTAAWVAVVVWLAAAGVTLHAFWANPLYRGDDHRAAVRFLQDHWRPGDVVVVNAGWTYTALLTYWDGPVASRGRLTADLPTPRSDAELMLVTTGHVDGDPGLGWADPRSDFFAMPSDATARQIDALFGRFGRVWHYRIYDTVNDPGGLVRGLLDANGRLFEDQVFTGEANMRVQGFIPRGGAIWSAEAPTVGYAAGVSLQWSAPTTDVPAGETLYGTLTWRTDAPAPADIATSLRLVDGDGAIWAQPPDERPLGSLLPSSQWPVGEAVRQPIALPIPRGTPPGRYTLALLVYDPAIGKPWPPQDYRERLIAVPESLNLMGVDVTRPEPPSAPQTALARFGPLALVAATSPATGVAAGGQIPVEFLWQAAEPPAEPLVVVVQLLDEGGRVVAGLEEEPTHGFYPTQNWAAGELVRDRHTLALPPDLRPGDYQLIVGVYRAADRVRLETKAGLFGKSNYWVVKRLEVR